MEKQYILETVGLSHCFTDGSLILNNINLQVPVGSIYGFLGPNGAGKTTALRLVLGLLKKQQGSIHIFGKSFDQNRIESLRKIGAMIESPSLYEHLTAAENLLVLQKVYQCHKNRIGKVLQLVGLADTGFKKTARFSLGMKQRLSIAMALLHEPSLLILDEPTNGLDPNGMIDIRELLLALNAELGISIVISSHLLGEIEKMVSHIGIINHGKLLFQGTLAQLQKEGLSSPRFLISTGNQEHTAAILRKNYIEPVLLGGNYIGIPMLTPEATASFVRELVAADIDLHELHATQSNLETIFMEMVTTKQKS